MQVIAASEYLKMRNKRLRISCYISRYSLSSSLNCIQLSRNNNLLEARSLNSDFWRLNHYMAFYIIDEPEKTVHVIRFLYQKRNWIQILKREPVPFV